MEYLIHIGIIACSYALLALALNLLIGESGLVSVAQAGFAGVGAYTAAIAMTALGVNFFFAALLGALFAALVAFVVGIIFLPLREAYYVLGTVGVNVIAWSVFLNWSSVTQGSLGIAGIPRPELFGFAFSTNAAFLLLSLLSVAVVYALSFFITHSSLGRVLHAIREDESAIAVFGYATTHYKIFIFTLAAAISGFAGALFASYISYISPQSFVVTESIFLLSIVVLGGLGSARGALVAALLLVILPEGLRFVGFPSEFAGHLRLMCYGLVLIFFMLYRPQGLFGTFRI